MYISKDVTPAVARRRAVEIEIIKATVEALLAAGFQLSVFDGEDTSPISTDPKVIHDALYNTDEDYLHVFQKTDEHHLGNFGWVRFVYGNDGWDVINDYTVNLEPFIGEGTEVQKLIDKHS